MPAFLQNGILIAILAHLLIGASLVWDKILLRQPHMQNVVNYIFWLGAMSIFGLILILFGFKMPSLDVIALAFGAGVLNLVATFFYYKALKRGEASQTLAIMGGFSPTATALIAIPLLKQRLGGQELIGFAVMVAGGFFMFFAEKIDWKRILPFVLAAAGTFGLANVLQKVAFDATNFVSAYVFFTIGTFAGALLLLIRPSWRAQIFHESEEVSPRSRFWYFVNRFVNGLGSFLVFLAISRANPAIVDAISGLRYAVIFLLSFALTRWKPDWLHEEFTRWPLIAKSIATSTVIAGLFLVGLAEGPNGGAGASLGATDPLLIAERGGPPRRQRPGLPAISASELLL